jgi:hypothetical protein
VRAAQENSTFEAAPRLLRTRAGLFRGGDRRPAPLFLPLALVPPSFFFFTVCMSVSITM